VTRPSECPFRWKLSPWDDATIHEPGGHSCTRLIRHFGVHDCSCGARHVHEGDNRPTYEPLPPAPRRSKPYRPQPDNTHLWDVANRFEMSQGRHEHRLFYVKMSRKFQNWPREYIPPTCRTISPESAAAYLDFAWRRRRAGAITCLMIGLGILEVL
jgi:hypothetical protein